MQDLYDRTKQKQYFEEIQAHFFVPQIAGAYIAF